MRSRWSRPVHRVHRVGHGRHAAHAARVTRPRRGHRGSLATVRSALPVRRRVLAVGLAMALSVVTLTAVGITSLSPFHAAASAGAAPTCQSDGNAGCTATLPCATAPCPTVDVAPATSLSDGQYVFVKATNFPSGDSMRIALCSTLTSASDPSCLNGVWESNTWGPVQVPITVQSTEDNVTQAAVPVFFDQDGEGNDPLPAHDVTNTQGSVAGFYCDDSADPCAIEVTEETGTGNVVGNGPEDSTDNTVVVPLNFAAQNAGCPASDTQLLTDSSFSLEHFLPAAVDATCTGSTGVVALNTATDNETVSSDFASGGVDVGFVDNPADATQEATLFGGTQFAYIPVAVSGTSVGMLAGESDPDGTAFPVSQYDLTPNMVAGLLTSEYETATGTVQAFSPYNFELTDNLVAAWNNLTPPLTCANLLGCPVANKKAQIPAERQYELQYNTFDVLNPVSSGNFGPDIFGSFNSDIPNGSSYQATNWICSAPNTPYTVDVNEVTPPAGQSNPVPVTVTDTNAANTTLTTAPTGSQVWPPIGSPNEPWVFPSCQPYSKFPSLATSSNDYGESQSPALQAKAIRQFAYGGGSVPVVAGGSYTQMPAGFGIMDSSEASFYGLNTASLENADGNFEAPTVANLEAAEANITPCPTDDLSCPAGTYKINYTTTTSPNAYPMPDITYAMVPTAPLPASEAAALKNLLTNLVTFSHGGGSLALPSGYAPLSDSLYQTALTDISNDVVAEPPTPSTTVSTTPTTPTTPTTTTESSGSSSGGSSGGSSSGDTGEGTSSFTGGSDDDLGALPLSSTSTPSSSTPSSSSDKGSVLAGTAAPTGFLLVSLDDAARYLLPAIVLLAIACLIGGPLLLFAPALRRRRRSQGGRS
jgi:hypothetical protein